MEKCDCYEEVIRQRPLDEFEQGVQYALTGKFVKYKDTTVAICNGTKER